jgi:DNA modification methylase
MTEQSGLFAEVSRGAVVPSAVDGDIVLSDAQDLLRSLDPGSVACIVTDPPYGIAYHSNHHKERNPHAPIAQDWNFQIGSYLAAAERVLRDGGAIYMFTRFDVYPLWTREIPPSLSLKNMIVWDKGNHSSGDLTGNFGFRHEVIMFITKGRHALRGKRHPNVWQFPRVPSPKQRMPAEKPVGMYERCLEASTDPGDLVVDTFGGSGTMAEAAVRTGRRFLVCDVDKKMVRMSRERVGFPIGGDEDARSVVVPVCPVFSVIPPSPALWGLHPEDLADWRSAPTGVTPA